MYNGASVTSVTGYDGEANPSYILGITQTTADEFATWGTRVLPITRETRTINAYGYQRGDLRGMPEWCITVGMEQILASRKIYIALNRPWQNGPFKHALYANEQPQLPATLLRRCRRLIYCITREIAADII